MSAETQIMLLFWFFNSCFEIIYFALAKHERQIFYLIKYPKLITAQNVMRKIFFFHLLINSFQLFIFFKLSALKTSLRYLDEKYVLLNLLDISFSTLFWMFQNWTSAKWKFWSIIARDLSFKKLFTKMFSNFLSLSSLLKENFYWLKENKDKLKEIREEFYLKFLLTMFEFLLRRDLLMMSSKLTPSNSR